MSKPDKHSSPLSFQSAASLNLADADEKHPSRRRFITTTLAAGAVGIVGGSGTPHRTAASDAQVKCLVDLQLADFEPLLGQKFTMRGPCGAATVGRTVVKLAGVNDLSHESDVRRPAEIRASSFMLRFEGPAGETVGAGTHLFSHPEFEPTSIFVNRMAASEDPHRCYYEVVFN